MRQRGAGRPVLSDGFVIQPVGGAPAGEAAPASAPPKAISPSTKQVPPRRTSPRTKIAISEVNKVTHEALRPSPLHEEAPIAPDKPDVTRGTPPRGAMSVSSDAPALPVITTTRTSAVAAATPILRGKRTRQPSPDKFLTAPEADGISERRLNTAAERRQEKLAMRQRGAGTRKIADIGFTIQPLQPAAKAPILSEKESNEAEEQQLVEEIETQVQKQVLMENDGLGGTSNEGGDAGTEKEGRSGRDGTTEGPNKEGEQQIIQDQVIEMEIEEPTQAAGESIIQQIVPRDSDRSQNDALAAPIISSENQNKRRKVMPEDEGESELTEGLQPVRNLAHNLAEGGEREMPLEVGPKRKRQLVGKKPASPRVPIDEEDGEEDYQANGQGPEQELETTEDISDAEEEAESDTESRPKSRKSPSAQPPKQPKQKQSKPRLPREDGKTQTYPVIVHRLSKSASYKLPPGSNRSGVNPVDVINQVVGEILDKHWEKTAKSSHEKKAVAAFKEEFSCRLLEVTDELERSISLTARVRQAQKRRAQLVAELLEVKRKRSKVAVKMDDVRKEHEMAVRSSENQNHISQTFADVTHTIERGKARGLDEVEEGMEGLEAMIRTVAAAVTGGGRDGTGTLATVMDFNRFLERAEAVLRERKY